MCVDKMDYLCASLSIASGSSASHDAEEPLGVVSFQLQGAEDAVREVVR